MPRRKYRPTTVWRARVLNSVRSTAKPRSFEVSIRFRLRSHASATTWVPAIARTESAEPERVFLIAAAGERSGGLADHDAIPALREVDGEHAVGGSHVVRGHLDLHPIEAGREDEHPGRAGGREEAELAGRRGQREAEVQRAGLIRLDVAGPEIGLARPLEERGRGKLGGGRGGAVGPPHPHFQHAAAAVARGTGAAHHQVAEVAGHAARVDDVTGEVRRARVEVDLQPPHPRELADGSPDPVPHGQTWYRGAGAARNARVSARRSLARHSAPRSRRARRRRVRRAAGARGTRAGSPGGPR